MNALLTVGTHKTHIGDVFTRAAIDPSVFTIKEKAPGAFSWLKAPISAFTFRTLQSIDFRVSRGGSLEGRVSRLRFW